MANTVEKMDRQEQLASNKDKMSNDRVLLVIKWHHYFKGLVPILKRNHKMMLEDHPELIAIFSRTIHSDFPT